ncbi:DUF3040 domain-containing protein [Streptomyces sp. TRM49041]|uniref:DUF3040 domain-containing protein n=1 Tax=Streptomyces sp. TRM49041 TaxID=2603216 RepID=UPI0011EDAED1|nr:DUF3040 domain-containing protein [Streptomyces sp. TRM49041]
MASGMDEDRLLAEIERLLAREDPDLDARMSALGRQFTGEPPEPSGHADTGGVRRGRGRRRDWRKVVAVVAVVVAVVGLVLTAVLMQPADSGSDQLPPAGMPAAVAFRT